MVTRTDTVRTLYFIHMVLWAQIIRNAGFYAGATDDQLKEQTQAENEVYEESQGPARHF